MRVSNLKTTNNTKVCISCSILLIKTSLNALKKKWRGMKDRTKKGSELVPEELLPWCYTLESALRDINIKLQDVVSNPRDTLYGQPYFDSGKWTKLVTQKYVSNDKEEDQIKVDEELDYIDENDLDQSEEKSRSAVKKKPLAKLHQKRKFIRSPTQALNQLTSGMTQMAESEAKRCKSYIDFERKREKRL